jgi:phosphoglycolate phosphatase
MFMENPCFLSETGKMKYKSIIFDLDGTLLDTLDDLTDAMNQALVLLGQPIRSRDQCREMIGRGLTEFARAALPPDRGHLLDALLRKMREIYKTICLNRTYPYPGIKDVLFHCRKAGIRTAVLSNKAHDLTVQITEHYFGKNTFDQILGQKDNVPCKPDPEPIRLLLEKMALIPRDVLYVGDSEVDVKTAQNAGVDFIAAGWGFRSPEQLRQAGAEKIIYQPAQLLESIRC